MFAATVYTRRRQALRQRLSNGIVLLIGHGEAPINFALNNYPFRQDGTFSYFFGNNQPGLVGIIDLDADIDTLFVEERDHSDTIWLGEPIPAAQLAAASGSHHLRALGQVQSAVNHAQRSGRSVHFLPPCRGETALKLAQLTQLAPILHLFEHGNRSVDGDLMINDAAACSALGYASDVTRTLPVGGRFQPHQRELYDVLLDAQLHAIEQSRAGSAFLKVHQQAALKLAEGMQALDFFNGSPADIVESGAYALAFPHGLGHLLGLDVPDMDALGEDLVGYDAEVSRSPQFGLCHLRLGKTLKRGMVLTVEPGIYFIPALIQRWQAENRHAGLINYSRFRDHEHFGGMRIEDVVVVQADAGQVLGPAIPKQAEAIESALA